MFIECCLMYFLTVETAEKNLKGKEIALNPARRGKGSR
jgi:hypothetical protein